LVQKIGVIGGLDLPEKAEHTREGEREDRERKREVWFRWYSSTDKLLVVMLKTTHNQTNKV